jgi:hypothetical protein
MRYLILLCPSLLSAQFLYLGAQTTYTQATLRYNPGTSAACTIQVTDSNGNLVNDVNASLGGDFAGANSDAQYAGNAIGNNREFTIGQHGVTGIGSDGKKRSRALQALSQYQVQWTCGGFPSPIYSFKTQNIPVGDTHNEGVPVDRAHPGQYALDDVNWNDPTQIMIHPLKGIASQRVTPLADVASGTQAFVTAIPGTGWSGSPISGTATFAGTGSQTHAMFVRADGFTISGGATHARSTGGSFDWGKVSVTASSTASGQSMISCFIVNGVSCDPTAENTQAITTTPTAYVIGSGNLMECLQNSGRCPFSSVDVSTATGTASYVSGTGVFTWVSGNPFSIKWVAGSTISLGSTQCTVGSVQSERQITLSSCVGVTTGTYTFAANNFGWLVWLTGSGSITNATYTYGSATMPTFPALPTYSTGPLVTVGGVQGRYSLINSDLVFNPANGSAPTPKGQIVGIADGVGPMGQDCGSEKPYQWGPSIAGEMFCNAVYFGGGVHILRVQVTNDVGQAGTPGVVMPRCSPSLLCMAITDMSVNDVYTDLVTFNPTCGDFPFTLGESPAGGTGMGGNYMGVYASTGQDYFGCVGAYDRGTDNPATPAGTDAGSFKIIAAMRTASQPGSAWCNIHFPFGASSGAPGWISWSANEKNASEIYTATLTSTTQLGTSLTTCPTNPFGVTGNNCSAITITGDPENNVPATLQHVQVGDVMKPTSGSLEFVRMLQMTGTTSGVVQRGYLGGAVSSHTGTGLMMECGGLVQDSLINSDPAAQPMWDFKDDPTGTNSAYATIAAAIYSTGNHGNAGLANQSYTVQAGGANQPDSALCPTSGDPYCNIVFPGDYGQAFLSNIPPPNAISISPPFGGLNGISQPNGVDTHPGPALNDWIMDGRPFNGGYVGDGATNSPTLGTPGSPFTPTTGQCWLLTGATGINPKILTTMAYVGRFALVDMSGPNSASTFGCTSANSYERCHVTIAGECVPGSAVNSEYVNAPFVSYGYCNYAGIAVQGDDTNAICIGDLGAYTGNTTQQGVGTNDLFGATGRALGGGCNIWNRQYVFWTSNNTPSGLSSTNYWRWCNGLSSAIVTSFLPPFPAADGVNRGTFVPVNVRLPGGNSVSTATIEFWYAELGPGCTPRQEACVATSSAINQSTPFSWASETYTPQPCGTSDGCTFAIPALSGHIVNYRYKYRDASGALLYASAPRTTKVP